MVTLPPSDDQGRLFALVDDLLVATTTDGRILAANSAWQRLLGWAPEELTSRSVLGMVHPDDRSRMLQSFEPDGASSRHFDTRCRHRGEEWRSIVWRGTVHGDRWYGVGHDVTDRHRLEEIAFGDPLTGAASRLILGLRLQHALTRLRRDRGAVAAVSVDLDGFGVLNDRLGRDGGDAVLRAVAARLSAIVRPEDTVARLGPDEFLVLAEVTGAREAQAVGHRLVEAFAAPFSIADQPTSVRASMGLVIATDPATEPNDLLHGADVAVSRAKELGTVIETFDDALQVEIAERMRLIADLHRAVERGELRLAYQPLVRVVDGQVIAAEALLRWDHPELGPVPPGRFIELAEEDGIITDIGGWVLEQACAQAKSWHDAGEQIEIAVNVSTVQLAQPSFAQDVVAVLSGTGLRPTALWLEVTETALVQDPDMARSNLDALRHQGVRIAVDDFGEGHASLVYLRSLPIDMVKVGRSLVGRAAESRQDRDTLTAVHALARAMGVDLLVEGVETAAEADVVRQVGCAMAQGYWYGRPGAADGVHDGRMARRALAAGG